MCVCMDGWTGSIRCRCDCDLSVGFAAVHGQEDALHKMIRTMPVRLRQRIISSRLNNTVWLCTCDHYGTSTGSCTHGLPAALVVMLPEAGVRNLRQLLEKVSRKATRPQHVR